MRNNDPTIPTPERIRKALDIIILPELFAEGSILLPEDRMDERMEKKRAALTSRAKAAYFEIDGPVFVT